jgi:signal transduction histidine kinase
MPPEAGDLLGVLLASTFPLSGHGCRVLRPLWADEAMHRAYSFVRLIDTRTRRGGSTVDDPSVAQVADVIACDLAVCFRDLTVGSERDVVPCFAVLRDVLTGLGSLFGGPANITLETNIEEAWLPAYKRRALVLAASELVSNALLHAFRGRTAGKIEVWLTAQDSTSACLRVADNGRGFTDASPNLDYGLGAGLAGLLEADLAYDRVAGWTVAEIEFPLTGS